MDGAACLACLACWTGRTADGWQRLHKRVGSPVFMTKELKRRNYVRKKENVGGGNE